MRRFSSLFLCVAVLVFSSSAFAQQDPDKIVREIYAAYSGDGLGVAPSDPYYRDLFSARLARLLAREDDRVRRNGLGRLDFDIFVDGQDFDVTNVEIGAPRIQGDTASVEVRLLNFGEPRHFKFDFVRENGDWRIDEICVVDAGTPWELTALLTGN